MPRPKGVQKTKGSGRKAGTPNKITRTMRELLSDFCTENYDEFLRSWNRIDEPKDKCAIYLKAQEFVTPKLSSVDLQDRNAQKELQDELEQIAKES